jgi:proline iminopeptidase
VSVQLSDGVSLHVVERGSGFPLLLVHGGPGGDHSYWVPWLEPLADEFRLVFYDQRGHGRSDRVSGEQLTLEEFGADVDRLAEALELDEFAVLGHSFGAVVAAWHAIERGTAAAYVLSHGTDSTAGLESDLKTSFGAERPEIVEAWARERTVQTEEEAREIYDIKRTAFFYGDAPPGFGDGTVYAPETLRHMATAGFGDFDFPPQLARVTKPTLVIAGEHDGSCTPRAARVLHAGIAGSEFVLLPDSAHMGFAERQDEYLDAVRTFLRRAVA